MTAVGIANSNVALAKYWGKRNVALNLPYTGSISVTLAGLSTTVTTTFRSHLNGDRIVLSGQPASRPEAERVTGFLDLVRARAGTRSPAEVEIRSTFPVAAGLASSASTFAALAVSATRAAGLALAPRELSLLARRGSGSAARSIFGGYVEWFAGENTDGSDSFAAPILEAGEWRIGIVIAITHEGPKRIGSREGMLQVAKASPFFPAWLASHDADLDAVRAGIRARDLARVGEAAEHNCLKMHAAAISAQPPLLYWTPATLAVIQRVWRLREDGFAAYFTIDAGPQVKVLCAWEQRAAVADAIGSVTGVQRVILSEPGAGATLAEGA